MVALILGVGGDSCTQRSSSCGGHRSNSSILLLLQCCYSVPSDLLLLPHIGLIHPKVRGQASFEPVSKVWLPGHRAGLSGIWRYLAWETSLILPLAIRPKPESICRYLDQRNCSLVPHSPGRISRFQYITSKSSYKNVIQNFQYFK